MKASLTLLAVAASAAAFAGQAVASSNIGITIRHQLVGCHSWAVGNGAYKPTQMVSIKAGTSLTFNDNDVMSHTIVQLAGPKLAHPRRPPREDRRSHRSSSASPARTSSERRPARTTRRAS